MKNYLTLCISLIVSIANAQTQMGIWTFPTVSNASTTSLTPTAEILSGTPSLTQFFQTIDDNGKGGVTYTDVESILHTAGSAIAWNDIKGGGTDAELQIEFSTIDW